MADFLFWGSYTLNLVFQATLHPIDGMLQTAHTLYMFRVDAPLTSADRSNSL